MHPRVLSRMSRATHTSKPSTATCSCERTPAAPLHQPSHGTFRWRTPSHTRLWLQQTVGCPQAQASCRVHLPGSQTARSAATPRHACLHRRCRCRRVQPGTCVARHSRHAALRTPPGWLRCYAHTPAGRALQRHRSPATGRSVWETTM